MSFLKNRTMCNLVIIFIFLQACSAEYLYNSSNPETREYWFRFLIQKEDIISEINMETEIREETIESETEIFDEDLGSLSLEWVLLQGAPRARTYGMNIGIDHNDFIYVAGDTNEALFQRQLIGRRDVILGKYDSHKNIIWRRQIGASQAILQVKDFGVDPNGNSYILGLTWNDFAGPASSKSELFLIKFNSEGTQIWAKRVGNRGLYDLYPDKIAIDELGNSYIIGNSTGSFEDNTSGNCTFVLKFDTNGNQIWIKQIAIAGTTIVPNGVAIDKVTGSIYITGSGNANFETLSRLSADTNLFFIFKYDSNGSRQFFAQLGFTSSTTEGISISLDPLSNVFVGGNTNVDLESGEQTNFRGFLVKYDSSGFLKWIRHFGPISSDKQTVVNAILTDEVGNVFLTGGSNANLLDEAESSVGNEDLFLIKYNSSGETKWFQQVGTVESSIDSTGLARDSEGNLYCSGYSNGSINEVSKIGFQDLFILKYR
ncbi:SBBP repeat beta-propeller lipoprotein, LipL53 family [Leptospira kirschneri]|uniref:Beta-propeller repeat protein n=1 Tax=Leptospira kirschneri str. 200802841 TaxID=1193047 RepID=A0A828XXH2_9LEPT|nr:SBBP repeat-containing protein [Leptospira kirschneri]EKO49896.1 beta-propeller repeat protein [Leptospira kirschneri str. 200802841]EMO82097.1 beta-propeller repeat protein [Leptospira kirschneri str. 200801774]